MLDRKDVQEEECSMIIASEERLTKILLNDENRKEKEWIECQGKLSNLTINNDQLSIDMRKSKNFPHQNRLDKTKKDTNNNKDFEKNECNETFKNQKRSYEERKK